MNSVWRLRDIQYTISPLSVHHRYVDGTQQAFASQIKSTVWVVIAAQFETELLGLQTSKSIKIILSFKLVPFSLMFKDII